MHNQKSKLKAIYFSASEGTLDAVLSELEPLWKEEFDGLIEILTRKDVKSYVEENGCIGVPTEDSLETTEMEICYRASAFIRLNFNIKLFETKLLEHNILSGAARLISNVGQTGSERFPISFLRKSLIYINKL